MVNADDFGFSDGVNRGIVEAHAAGTVSAVSVLVNAAGWQDARARLATLGRTLDVGLHLNLTAGAPLTAARTLSDHRTGRFHALPALVARALAGRLDPNEVAAECAAQLARLRDVGASVTHLDGHRHAHLLPGVWPSVVALARRYGLAVRLPLEPRWVPGRRGRALAKRLALWASWRVASRGVPPPGARGPVARFYGVSLEGDPAFERRLLALLDRLEPGTTELMVHPGYPDAALAEWDHYGAPRAVELAALTGPRVRERLRRGDLRLVGFGAP